MAALIEVTRRGYCGWTYTDRDGTDYPCDRPSWRRLVNAPEMWEGEFCKYHAPRALKRAIAEEEAEKMWL